MRRHRVWGVLALVLSTVLGTMAGLTPAAGATGGTAAAPSIVWGPCGPFFTHLDVPPPIWDRLQAGCGTLQVPLSYTVDTGATIELAVMRLPARRPELRLGTLVVNPGGPGGSGVTAMFDLVALPAEVRDRFDLVGFDPRGMVRSEPIDCYPSAPVVDDERELWGVVHRRVVACASTYGWLLPHLGTTNVARDLERLRVALGEAQLNFLGFSYGTAIGATYARLHPDRVRAFVLDGPVDTSTPFDQLLVEQTLLGAEQLFRRFAGACDASPATCAIAGRVDASWAAVIAHARAGTLKVAFPQRVPMAPPDVLAGSMTVAFARSLLFELLGDPVRWPSVARAIAAGATGDATGFVEQVLGGATVVLGRDPFLQAEGFVAVTCLDTHDRPTLADVTAARRTLEAQAPTFGDTFLAESALSCAFWSAPTDPVVTTPAGGSSATGAPILLVGTTGDPSTPYPWAQALQRSLPGSRLLTYEGVGHTVVASGRSRCIDETVTRYLVDGTVPPVGATCPGQVNPFTTGLAVDPPRDPLPVPRPLPSTPPPGEADPLPTPPAISAGTGTTGAGTTEAGAAVG